MRALYMLILLTAVGSVFGRTLVEAKPYEVGRDVGNPSSSRDKNRGWNNIERNDDNNNYDDINNQNSGGKEIGDFWSDREAKVSVLNNMEEKNYENVKHDYNDDDDGDDDDDDDDDDDNSNFWSSRDPKNSLRNNIEENDNDNNKLDHYEDNEEDDGGDDEENEDNEDNEDNEENDNNIFLELIQMVINRLMEIIEDTFCEIPIFNIICNDMNIKRKAKLYVNYNF
ncbi:protein PFC0760c-like [Mycetomoellerius zeteki]|uniref:protein PFC0760c-like n=1 Tax=Mycetomoellerius zeteki TaxID=64791 RepID=UPI00084ECDDB|nr:PREDICTED: protein PFC0760c-like [Trachymyrmex zeteki]